MFALSIFKIAKKEYMLKILFLASCLFLITTISAQEDSVVLKESTNKLASADLLNMNIETLLDLNIEVISATKQLQKISDAPAIITVITSKEIKERGYGTVAEAVSSVAGIDIITDYYQPNLGIRGINSGLRSYSRIIKVMINGQNISNRSSSDNYLSQSLIPVDIIDRIEIIRGPNSALYGADAYLGVINIITKSGYDIKGGMNSVSVGIKESNLNYNLELLAGLNKKGFDFIFALSTNKIDVSNISPQNLPNQKNWNESDKTTNFISRPLSVYSNLSYENKRFGEVKIDGNVQYIDAYSEFADWAPLTHENRFHFYNSYIRTDYNKEFLKLVDLNLSYAFSKMAPLDQEQFHTGKNSNPIRFREVGYNSHDIKCEGNIKFKEKNSTTIGVDYVIDDHKHQTYYDLSDNETAPLFVEEPSGDLSNFGLYFQTIINPFSLVNSTFPLTLTGGIRYDLHNIYGDNLNWRASLVFGLKEKIFFKILYGTSYKAPSSSQLYTHQINDFGIYGNEDCKTENASIVDVQILSKLTKHLTLNADVFYNVTKKKIEIVEIVGTNNSQAQNNLNDIKSFGGEFELLCSFDKFKSYLNYSIQKSVIPKEIIVRTIEAGSVIDIDTTKILIDTDLYPSHMLKFGLNYKIPEVFLNFNIEGRYIGKRIGSEYNCREEDELNNDPDTIPFVNEFYFNLDQEKYYNERYKLSGYFIMDFLLSTSGLKFINNHETELRIKVENVLNTKYKFPGFKYRKNTDFDAYDIPGIGRSFSFTIVQHF